MEGARQVPNVLINKILGPSCCVLGVPGLLGGPSAPSCLSGQLEPRTQLLARGWALSWVTTGTSSQVRPGPALQKLLVVTEAQTGRVTQCDWGCDGREAQRKQGPSLGSGKASRRRKQVTGSSRMTRNKRHGPGRENKELEAGGVK